MISVDPPVIKGRTFWLCWGNSGGWYLFRSENGWKLTLGRFSVAWQRYDIECVLGIYARDLDALERQVTTLTETERDLRALVASLQRGDGV